MAGLKSDARGNRLVTFRYGGKQLTKSAGTREIKVAEAVKARVEDMLFRLANGYVVIPKGAEPGKFIMSGGQRTAKAFVESSPAALTLGDLFQLYDTNFPAGSKADTTVQTEGHHKAHLLRVLTAEVGVESLTFAHLQDNANRRSRETWRGKPILPLTILKELATLRVILNWGRKQGRVTIKTPYLDKDLNFARTEQKPLKCAPELGPTGWRLYGTATGPVWRQPTSRISAPETEIHGRSGPASANDMTAPLDRAPAQR